MIRRRTKGARDLNFESYLSNKSRILMHANLDKTFSSSTENVAAEINKVIQPLLLNNVLSKDNTGALVSGSISSNSSSSNANSSSASSLTLPVTAGAANLCVGSDSTNQLVFLNPLEMEYTQITPLLIKSAANGTTKIRASATQNASYVLELPAAHGLQNSVLRVTNLQQGIVNSIPVVETAWDTLDDLKKIDNLQIKSNFSGLCFYLGVEDYLTENYKIVYPNTAPTPAQILSVDTITTEQINTAVSGNPAYENSKKVKMKWVDVPSANSSGLQTDIQLANQNGGELNLQMSTSTNIKYKFRFPSTLPIMHKTIRIKQVQMDAGVQIAEMEWVDLPSGISGDNVFIENKTDATKGVALQVATTHDKKWAIEFPNVLPVGGKFLSVDSVAVDGDTTIGKLKWVDAPASASSSSTSSFVPAFFNSRIDNVTLTQNSQQILFFVRQNLNFTIGSQAIWSDPLSAANHVTMKSYDNPKGIKATVAGHYLVTISGTVLHSMTFNGGHIVLKKLQNSTTSIEASLNYNMASTMTQNTDNYVVFSRTAFVSLDVNDSIWIEFEGSGGVTLSEVTFDCVRIN